MLTRLLSIAIVSAFVVAAQAQLPSDRFSPINYLGRYSGFGYSEGYHACKDGRSNSCNSSNSKSMWKPWESMSSFYGSATTPPNNRSVGMRTTHVAPLYSQEYNPSASPVQSMDVAPMQIPMAIPLTQPNTFETQPSTFATPKNLLQQDPSPTRSYESVPPAPTQKQSSPSDRDRLELPAPAKTSEYFPTSGMQNVRVTPGSRSVVTPSAFQHR